MPDNDGLCGPCIDGDHDDCTLGPCMCIDMEHYADDERFIVTRPRCPDCGTYLEVRRLIGDPEPELWMVLAVHTGSGKCLRNRTDSGVTRLALTPSRALAAAGVEWTEPRDTVVAALIAGGYSELGANSWADRLWKGTA